MLFHYFYSHFEEHLYLYQLLVTKGTLNYTVSVPFHHLQICLAKVDSAFKPLNQSLCLKKKFFLFKIWILISVLICNEFFHMTKTISARNVQTICNIKYIDFGLRSQVVNIGSWSYVFNHRFEFPVPGPWILSLRSWVWRPSPFSNYYKMWQKLTSSLHGKFVRKLLEERQVLQSLKKSFWEVWRLLQSYI